MNTDNAKTDSLAGLLEEHDALFGLFDSHQRALLARDIDNAVPIFSKFQEDLLRHIGFEEECVLPKYAQEGGETAGGTLAIFQAEHRKLREMMDKLATETLALYTAGDVDAQIIAIFDQETLFKGLLKHHALREQNILIPRLEARTTTKERKQLLEKHAHLEQRPAAAAAGVQRFVDTFAVL
jgi:hemerythrin-like domain-containing protein